MNRLLLFSLLFTNTIIAQTSLKFDKRFVQSEDKWVAFEKNDESLYTYGFIYIDAQAGLTLNYEGTFKISPTGEFVPKKIDSTNFKVRLKPNDVLVAFIPESKFQELKIDSTPEWLKYYKEDENSIARLYRWGYMYNGWNECEKALEFLEKAEKTDANYKGLAVELAFSYNCLEQYNKAVSVLQKAITDNPKDAYTNKELVYALIKSGQLDKASESCKNALAICTDKTYNGENCYNLLYEFYIKKDKANFNTWIDETKKWNASNDKLLRDIEVMKNEINK